MTRAKSFHWIPGWLAVLAAVSLTGCPTATSPLLSVTPRVLNFGSSGVQESIAILNNGGGTLEWTVEEDIPWLTVDKSLGSTTTETDRVKLAASRDGLMPGLYSGTVTVASNGGTETVSVAMKVPGTPQLEVSPQVANFVGDQDTAVFTLRNTGDEALTWNLGLADPGNSEALLPLPAGVTASPALGGIPAESEIDIEVEIDRAVLGDEPASIVLRIVSTGGSQTLTLNLVGDAGSALTVDPQVLEFGTDTTQLTLDVYNSGAAGSVINFNLTTDRPDLIFFEPATGSSTGTNNLVKDVVSVAVTLDRGALKGESDGGKVFVNVPGFAPVEVLVTAEAAPIKVEGAVNRSRQPFIMRFVFLLRDSLGKTIDSNDPEILETLQTAFTVEEDGTPLDTDETNLFVDDGKNLKYNTVLLLDYTGSMYHATEVPGAAIDRMVAAAREFVRDVPPSYRVAVMEYHERQQVNRLIHGFSTARQPILDAIDAFSVPPAEHGASELFDALQAAVDLLANEDVQVLPLDDADVRAVVFISDGRDTSSKISAEELVRSAKDNRVRLYPIGFGKALNTPLLVQLAEETGGHYYAAPTVDALVNLLENESALGPAAPGEVVKDLSRQVVLTYNTLFQDGTHNYLITVEYEGKQGHFERDGIYALGGDVRAGQIALTTSGIEADGTAEVYMRAEYVPRNVTQIRFRLITDKPYTLEWPENGLLEDWVLVDEGGGVYTLLTTEDRPLRYSSFGNLLKIRFENLGLQPFSLGFRIDNRILVNPPFTKYFQYPDFIVISEESATATVLPIQLEQGFDPDAPDAWNRDGDPAADFDDRFPDDKVMW